MAKTASESFADILDMPATEVERPKPKPVGSYLWTVTGMPEHGESSKKKTPFVKFKLTAVQAFDDVDTKELAAAGGVEGMVTSTTFYKTPDALWRLIDFLDHCGIEADGKTVRQMIDETPNCQVGGNIIHENSQDGTQTYSKFGTSFKPE